MSLLTQTGNGLLSAGECIDDEDSQTSDKMEGKEKIAIKRRWDHQSGPSQEHDINGKRLVIFY